MAIIIPSKNIFGNSNLYKIKDNYIDRIEVNANDVSPNNEYNVSVYNYSKLYPEYTLDTELSNYKFNSVEGGAGGGLYQTAVSYVSLQAYYSKISISFSKSNKNTYINKVYSGKDNQNKNNINAIIYANKSVGTSSGIATYSNNKGNVIINTKDYTSSEDVSEIPSPTTSYTYKAPVISADSSINFIDKTDIGTASIIETSSTISITINILTGYENITAGGYYNSVGNTDKEFEVNGTCTKYIPNKIEITFNGDTLSIDLTEKVVALGQSESDNPYSVENNELLQTENYYSTESQKAIDLGYNKTLNIYKNGLETAEITCSISKYYDDNGNIAIYDDKDSEDITINVKIREEISALLITYYFYIDKALDFDFKIDYTQKFGSSTTKGTITFPKGATEVKFRYLGSTVVSSSLTVDRTYLQCNMLFNVNDLVIPMKYVDSNNDIPLSIDNNGNAKVFKVINRKLMYDGAVWQVLSLQEYKEVI